MEIVSEIPALPGLAPNKSHHGGISAAIATGHWTPHSAPDTSLLYRHTKHVLEVRNLSGPIFNAPEALATLTTAQLQKNLAEELEIALVKSVYLDQTTYLVLLLRETVTKTARLCVFDPFTLVIYPVSAEISYRTRSLSVSAPLEAGKGSSKQWEYAVVCLGLSGGRIHIGNLVIESGGAQLTAPEKLSLDEHKSDVSCSASYELCRTNGRSIVFVGLASGHVALVDYCAYGLDRVRVLGTILPENKSLGPVRRLAAVALENNRYVLAVAHSATKNTKTGASFSSAVCVHSVGIDVGNRSLAQMSAVRVGLAPMQLLIEDELDSTAEPMRQSITNAKIADLAVVEMAGAGVPAGELDIAPRTVVVVALASASVDSAVLNPRGGSMSATAGDSHGDDNDNGDGALCGILNAWALNSDASDLVNVSIQNTLVSEAPLGMMISGPAGQIDVFTGRQALIGDALLDSLDSAGASASSLVVDHGVGQSLSIERYIAPAGSFAYVPSVHSALREQRRFMDGELFIDLLLQMAGVSESSSKVEYPPKSSSELLDLVELVGGSDLDDLKQQCIAYYLLLDLSAKRVVSSESGLYTKASADTTFTCEGAAKYAANKCIPRHFEYLIRGYWLLDHAQTATGIAYLADPCVIADWAPKILRTAVASGHHTEAARFLNSATALMLPRLEELVSEASVVMDVFLHCDFDRAFSFQRHKSSTPELRQALLTQLFAYAFSPNAAYSTVDRLAALPFDNTEELALEAFCLLPETAAHARDFLALHFVNRGRYAEAIRLFRVATETKTGEQLSVAQRRKHAERLMMIQNLMLLLPAAQRWVIDEIESMVEYARVERYPQVVPVSIDSEAEMNDSDGVPCDSRMTTDMDITSVPFHQVLSKKYVLGAPLSALKSVRQQQPVVGVHGSAQDAATNPLLRVLIKQMAVVKPSSLTVTAAHDNTMQLEKDGSAMTVSVNTQSTNIVEQQSSLVDMDSDESDSESAGLDNQQFKTPMTSAPNRKLQLDTLATANAIVFSPKSNTPTGTLRSTPLTRSMTRARVAVGSGNSSVLRVPFSGPPTTPHTESTVSLYMGDTAKPTTPTKKVETKSSKQSSKVRKRAEQ
ncbi:hypothetical protein GGI07_004194 [Coemansia sp. Benny D115]|nr:hypothetical protein GGI07_004194 [Coemansia sp. Benny D115]